MFYLILPLELIYCDQKHLSQHKLIQYNASSPSGASYHLITWKRASEQINKKTYRYYLVSSRDIHQSGTQPCPLIASQTARMPS